MAALPYDALHTSPQKRRKIEIFECLDFFEEKKTKNVYTLGYNDFNNLVALTR